MIPEEAMRRAHALLACGERRVLGIAGEPGAGKSTLARSLEKALGAAAMVVPMDGFHLANAELERLGRATRKGAPDTFDAHGYVALLQRIRRCAPDETVYAPAFHRDIEESIAGEIPVPPEIRLVITEGNYLLLNEGAWRGVRALLDEAWFVDVDPRQRHEQLLARHMRYGRSREDALAWMQSTDESNAVLIAATAAQADFRVPWGLSAQSV
jgi:pantothenate kinase